MELRIRGDVWVCVTNTIDTIVQWVESVFLSHMHTVTHTYTPQLIKYAPSEQDVIIITAAKFAFIQCIMYDINSTRPSLPFIVLFFQVQISFSPLRVYVFIQTYCNILRQFLMCTLRHNSLLFMDEYKITIVSGHIHWNYLYEPVAFEKLSYKQLR